jgi:RNA polymerase sigma-70 factor (ECF subfamily)
MHAVSIHPTTSPSTSTSLTQDELAREVALRDRLLLDDGTAWLTFERSYTHVVHQAIARVTRRFSTVLDADDASEIYSIFLLQLLQNDKHKLRTFDPTRGSRLSSWLRLLATHAAYDFLRRRRRDANGDDAITESIASGDPDPFTCCLVREQAQRMSDLMAGLSERDQQFVQLYFGEGLEAEEVAERMGISIKTVYTKKHKISARLDGLVTGLGLAA